MNSQNDPRTPNMSIIIFYVCVCVCVRARAGVLKIPACMCVCVLKISTQGKVQLQTLLQKRKERMVSKDSIFQLHLNSNIYSSHIYYWVFINDYH